MAAIFPVFFRNLQYDKAPITEEIVFRSCVLGVMRLARCSWSSMIFLSPLWFGAGKNFACVVLYLCIHLRTAHLHHGWDLYNRFGKSRAALKRALLSLSKPKKPLTGVLRLNMMAASFPTVVYKSLRMVRGFRFSADW